MDEKKIPSFCNLALVENFYSQGNMVFISMYGTSIYWHITYVSAQHSEIERIIDKDFRSLQLTRPYGRSA